MLGAIDSIVVYPNDVPDQVLANELISDEQNGGSLKDNFSL